MKINSSVEVYRLTRYQKELLNNERIIGKTNIKNYLEKIIRNNILIEMGMIDKKKDVIVEKDLYSTQINFLLNSDDEANERNINKYVVATYYFELAKNFNKIALERKISRNKLWKIVKKNILIKEYNKTKLRIYKNIFRGQIIPSPQFVKNILKNNNDLPSFLSIIYLDEQIKPELKESYEKIIEYAKIV